MSPERVAEISSIATATTPEGYAAFRAVSQAEREEWFSIVSPRKTYPATAASRKAVKARAAKRQRLDSLADTRADDARALSTDADLAR